MTKFNQRKAEELFKSQIEVLLKGEDYSTEITTDRNEIAGVLEDDFADDIERTQAQAKVWFANGTKEWFSMYNSKWEFEGSKC